MPARAIGVKWLAVDPGQRKLDVKLTPPEKTEPRQPLAIPVAVTGLPPASDAYVMVAAVDVGILNLTSYQPPDPEAWFYGQRQLGLELRDLYGRLIDGSLGATGRLRTGGDGGGMTPKAVRRRRSSSPSSPGPVKLDADGKAIVDFDIPQFNGTARVMAVAWTKDAVGQPAPKSSSAIRSSSPPACRASWPPATQPTCASTSPTPTARPATIRWRSDRR